MTGDIFVFDIATYTWAKLLTSPNPRGGMACASAGDFIVAWRGYNDRTKLIPVDDLLFYNMKTDNWFIQSDISPPVSGTDMSTSKNNGTAIGGGVSAVIILAVVAGLMFYRTHKQARYNRRLQEFKLDSFTFHDKSDSTALPRTDLDHNTAHQPRQGWSRIITAETLAGEEGVLLTSERQDPQYQPPTTTQRKVLISQLYNKSRRNLDQFLQTQQSPNSPHVLIPLLPPIHNVPPRDLEYILQMQQPLNNPHSQINNTTFQEPGYFFQQQSLNSPHSPPSSPLIATSGSPQVSDSPQGQSRAMSAPIDSLEQIAHVQAVYAQNIEQMRRDQEAELERFRQQPSPPSRSHQTAVMDSKTGLLYIPRGLNMSTEMLLYNSLINSCIAAALPTPQLNVHCDARLACATVGGLFLAWGATTSGSASVTATGSGNTRGPITSRSSKSSNAVAIEGGVPGFVVMVTIVEFIFSVVASKQCTILRPRESTCDTPALPGNTPNANIAYSISSSDASPDIRASYITTAYSPSTPHTNISASFLTAESTSQFGLQLQPLPIFWLCSS
ncbi:MAG: hypothetical protein J3R72DRAFT_485402 [Linnemannia gamsii]|nr:MAG: hypothetical protein J3R72DRAFT_485402 [Linnemannia gamsii]